MFVCSDLAAKPPDAVARATKLMAEARAERPDGAVICLRLRTGGAASR